jgi:hypothetical protein
MRLIKVSNIYTIEKPLKNNDYLYFLVRKTVALLQQSVENSSCREAGTTE